MFYLFWTSLILIFFSYVGYPLTLRLITLFYSRKRKLDEDYEPYVSMVISAYNEQDAIAEKLNNCCSLEFPKEKLEILIGSDGSTDKTNAILETNCSSNIRPIFFNERRGKAVVINQLVEAATGEIIIFSDANTIYKRNSIKKLVRHFADDSVGGVCGRLNLLNPTKNVGGKGETIYWKYENFIKRFEGKIRTVIGANGAIYALRKKYYSVLAEDKVVVDDFVISMKVVEKGYDVVYEGEAEASETTSPDIQGEFRRKIRIGASNYNSLVELKSLLNPFKGFASFGFWSHKVLRWFVPFFLVLIFVSNLFYMPHLFYKVTMSSQMIFYASAIIAYFFDRHGQSNKLLLYPYYFCTVNLALAIGFLKFLNGSQTAKWSRVERT